MTRTNLKFLMHYDVSIPNVSLTEENLGRSAFSKNVTRPNKGKNKVNVDVFSNILRSLELKA